MNIFGIRVSLFFLFILGLECLAVLLSVYLGVLLYGGVPVKVSLSPVDQAINMAVFLIILFTISTPGFFRR